MLSSFCFVYFLDEGWAHRSLGDQEVEEQRWVLLWASEDRGWCEELFDLGESLVTICGPLKLLIFSQGAKENEWFVPCAGEEARQGGEVASKLLHILHFSGAPLINHRLELVQISFIPSLFQHKAQEFPRLNFERLLKGRGRHISYLFSNCMMFYRSSAWLRPSIILIILSLTYIYH